MKIVFKSTKDIEDFLTTSNAFEEDINIKCGHIEIDGKSVLALHRIGLNTDIEVDIITNDKNNANAFYSLIDKYRKE